MQQLDSAFENLFLKSTILQNLWPVPVLKLMVVIPFGTREGLNASTGSTGSPPAFGLIN